MSELLLDAMARWCSSAPSKRLFSWLDDRGVEKEGLSYSDVDERTRLLATRLMSECGLSPGDRVLLVFEPCLGFIVSFLACLRAGLIAVPVFPPGRFVRVLDHASAILSPYIHLSSDTLRFSVFLKLTIASLFSTQTRGA
jgi:acyl-CoA synthetase (AMP-forming)/AMP-acid ligase II